MFKILTLHQDTAINPQSITSSSDTLKTLHKDVLSCVTPYLGPKSLANLGTSCHTFHRDITTFSKNWNKDVTELMPLIPHLGPYQLIWILNRRSPYSKNIHINLSMRNASFYLAQNPNEKHIFQQAVQDYIQETYGTIVTPIFEQIRLRSLSTAQQTALIKRIERCPITILYQDEAELTLLHWAARQGHTELTKALIAMGSDTNAHNTMGVAPLHGASYWGRLKSIKLLHHARANINAQTAHGWTPLHMAIDRKKIPTIRYFIDKKANHSLPTNQYKTSRDLAKEKNLAWLFKKPKIRRH